MRLDLLPLECFQTFSEALNGLPLSDQQSELLAVPTLREAMSGNKFFKLGANLVAARQAGCGTLLSFGGKYSNHIYAMAAAARVFGFRSIGVIRAGDEQSPSTTMTAAQGWGMQFEFVSRAEYRELRCADAATLAARFAVNPQECWIIPEGGANQLACLAMAELAKWIESFVQERGIALEDLTVVLPCGTGGTLAGLRAALDARISIVGVPVLKAGAWLHRDIEFCLEQLGKQASGNWQLLKDYHSGGYARLDEPLIEFIHQHWRSYEVPLEPVYSGKLFHAIWSEIEHGRFNAGSHLLLLHTGGLQGIHGYLDQFSDLPWVRLDRSLGNA